MSMKNHEVSLVDQLGHLKSRIAMLQELERSITGQLKEQMTKEGAPSVEGDLYRASLSVSERTTIDSERVRSKFPQDKWPDFYKSSMVETLRVVARSTSN